MILKRKTLKMALLLSGSEMVICVMRYVGAYCIRPVESHKSQVEGKPELPAVIWVMRYGVVERI